MAKLVPVYGDTITKLTKNSSTFDCFLSCYSSSMCHICAHACVRLSYLCVQCVCGCAQAHFGSVCVRAGLQALIPWR